MTTERFDPGEWYEALWPVLFGCLDSAYPEFGWVRHGAKWVATRTDHLPGGPFERGRVWCRLPGRAGCGFGFQVHGAEAMTWTAFEHGGAEPRGQDRLRAIAEIARRAGVDPAPVEALLGGRTITDEDRARAAAELEARRAEAKTRQVEQERRERGEKARKRDAARALWERSVDDERSGGRIAEYLEARGVPVAALPGGKVPESLRFCADAAFGEFDEAGKWRVLEPGPCVVCAAWGEGGNGQWAMGNGDESPAFAGEGDGASVARGDSWGDSWGAWELLGVQRIFLDREGAPVKRADGKSAKLGLGVLDGASVDLGGQWDGRVYLTEGVETGLAVLAATGRRVLACISTSGLKNFVPPPAMVRAMEAGEIASVVIAGDHDPYKASVKGRPGEKYGWQAACRLAEMVSRWGVSVGISLPTEETAPELIGAGGRIK